MKIQEITFSQAEQEFLNQRTKVLENQLNGIIGNPSSTKDEQQNAIKLLHSRNNIKNWLLEHGTR